MHAAWTRHSFCGAVAYVPMAYMSMTLNCSGSIYKACRDGGLRADGMHGDQAYMSP